MDAIARARMRMVLPWALVAALGIGIGLSEWQGWPFLKGRLQAEFTRRLNRPVQFGDGFALHLLGAIRLHTDVLRIGPPAGAAAGSPLDGDLLAAADARLELPYSTVFGLMRSDSRQPPRITALTFERLDAELKRQADGSANWTFIRPAAAADKPPDASAATWPEVDELIIRAGHLTLDDAVSKTKLDAHVTLAEVEGGRQPAGLVIEGKGVYRDQPFDFRIEAGGLLPLLAPENRTARIPMAAKLNAGTTRFSFDGVGMDVLSFRQLDGAVALSGPSLAEVGAAVGVVLPTTAPFALKGQLGKSGQRWSLRKADLIVGDSRLSGQFAFDQRPTVPLLSGELAGSRFVLADLLPAFGAARANAPNPAPAPGRVLPQRELDTAALHRMNAEVALRLQRAELGTLFAQPLEPLLGNIDLHGGVLKISNLLARTAGGQVKGAFGIDAQPEQPVWTADLSWADIELERWLAARNTASRETKPSGQKPGYLSGRLGGRTQLKGQGKSMAKLLASVDGTAQAWIRDGTISHLVVEAIGLDIAQGLGMLIKGDDKLAIRCGLVGLKAADGKVAPEVAIVDTRDSTILMSGAISLAAESLDLTLTAKPKDISPITLRAPVKVEGTFADPRVRLLPKPLGGRLAMSAALALVNPLAALIPLFDPGERDAGGCERALQELRDARSGTPDVKQQRKSKAIAASASPAAAAAAPEPARR